jgi:hypothetical protein
MKINKDNYEAFLVDRMEGQISPEDAAELDLFLAENPAFQEDAALYELTRLEPDPAIIFANKEVLKHEEGARIIPLFAAVRWVSAAAAVLVLFAGIRYFRPVEQPTWTASKYDSKTSQPELPVQPIQLEQTSPIPNKQIEDATTQFAHQVQNTPDSTEAESPKLIREQELLAYQVAIGHVESLSVREIKPRIKTTDFEAQYANLYNYNYENMMKGVQAQPGSPETIIDRWNDAVAVVNDMSSAFGIGRKTEEAPSTEPRYRTTSINIFGIEYYNRKRINH